MNRIMMSLTARSLGRRWWTRVSVGHIHHDQFHWTERAAKERREKFGGQLLRRRGTRWDADWDYEKKLKAFREESTDA